ncbi:MAG: recombination-associated protein RdgC [Deltaproteobacteria bacterium]|nr:recombination-associated protein RdgC [Deltaproteobacteria bacterium]
MGLMHGTAAFTRYIAEKELPDDFMEGLSENIGRYAFRDLDEQSIDERSAGWVNIMDMFDHRFEGLEFLKEPYIAMSLRIDERKIPSTALRQYVRQAEEKVKEEEHLEFLSRNRREDVKEAVRLRLLKRAIPVTRTYDMIWNTLTGLVIFGCVSPRICDEFIHRFYLTFGIQLDAVCPYTLGELHLEKDEASLDLMDGLSPTRFLEEQ